MNKTHPGKGKHTKRRRYHQAVWSPTNANEALNQVVGIYVDCYISGLKIMNDLRIRFRNLRRGFPARANYKREVSIKTLMNTDKAMNRSLFDNILNDFQSKLERDFSRRFTEASIGELKQDLVAQWLAGLFNGV